MPDFQRLTGIAKAMALFVALLWILLGFSPALPFDPAQQFGVHPRDPAALHGILTAPLVHGSIYHLAANTPPLFVLGCAMFYGLPRGSRCR